MSNYITIPGFEKKSKQELFNMSLAHVRSTGQRSLNPSGGCCYSGIGCAASPFLLPEKRAAADAIAAISCSDWGGLVEENVVPYINYEFVGQLQMCHDRDFPGGGKFLTQYEARMEELARHHGLIYKSPEQQHVK